MGFVLLLIRLYLRALALVAPRVAGRRAYKIFSTPRTRRSVPPWAEDAMAEAEPLSFDVEGDEIQAYRWRPPEPDGAPRIVLMHGWESRGARLAAWAGPLTEAGFEVVTLDGPAHGESGGKQADPVSFVRCMSALAREVGPFDGCVGHSLGGFSCLTAAAAPAVLFPDDDDGRAAEAHRERFRFRRAVVIAGAESGVDAMRMFCDILGLGQSFAPLLLDGAAEQAGGPISSFDLHRTYPSCPIPTLWMHDPADEDVALAAAERVAATCGHVDLQQVHGLGHHKIVRDEDVIRRGVAFLSEILR